MKRVPGIGVRDVHIRQRKAVKQAATLISHIIKHHPLPQVETDSEAPLLPLYHMRGAFLRDREAHTLWLDDIERLHVLSQVLGFGDVFVGGLGVPWSWLADGVILAGGEVVDADDFHGNGIDDGRDWEWQGVVVGVGLIGVGGVSHVHEGLPETFVVLETIGAWIVC